MKLSNRFDVPLSIEEAWPILLDVERTARCVPGAELLEVLDDRAYKGKVLVKLGPITLTFTGSATFVEINEAQHCASLHATGTDLSGRGGAQAKTRFQLKPKGDHTEVLVETDLQLSGAVAQYGRASGVIEDMATQLVGEFAKCLSRQLAVSTPGGEAEASSQLQTGQAALAEPAAKPLDGLAFAWRVIVRRIRRWSAGLRGRA